jgi:hypothetical protein
MAAGHALLCFDDLIGNVRAARELFLRAADMFDFLHDPARSADAASYANDIDPAMPHHVAKWLEDEPGARCPGRRLVVRRIMDGLRHAAWAGR